MIRTHIVPCSLPRAEADALNRESGRVYSQTLTWQYRIKRRTDHWLSPAASERLGDFLSTTTLHAHSRDAAQQAFHKACKSAKANRGLEAKYPHKRKFYSTTIWKNTGIHINNGMLRLARARGLSAITLTLPPDLALLPQAAFVEMRLVYERVGRRYQWHLVVDDGVQPPDPPGEQTLAADLGEIHPAAVANEQGAVVIFTARELRALNQYCHKRLASLQRAQSHCKRRSLPVTRPQRRKMYLLARNNRQRRDIEHKVTRAIARYAKQEQARRLVVGDVRDVGKGKRLNANGQQKVSAWSLGPQIAFLTYKLAAEGIALERQSEAYSSKTCCACGAINKPTGRTYRCRMCGFVGHRDANGAVNQVSKALYGEYSHIQPRSIMYRRAFRRSSPEYPLGDGACSLGATPRSCEALAPAECHRIGTRRKPRRLNGSGTLSRNARTGAGRSERWQFSQILCVRTMQVVLQQQPSRTHARWAWSGLAPVNSWDMRNEIRPQRHSIPVPM